MCSDLTDSCRSAGSKVEPEDELGQLEDDDEEEKVASLVDCTWSLGQC